MSRAPADPRALLRELFDAALAAVEPGAALARAIERVDSTVRVTCETIAPERCAVIAAGKGALAMARAWQAHVGAPRAGLAVSREPGALPAPWRALVGGHPLPNAASEAAGRAALAFAANVPREDALVVLLSGGASALLSAPLAGVTLADLRETTELLLRAGAEIGELNCVRKHLTVASGGRLAAATPARRVVVLALSDVIGDDLATIGSGPCAPDPTTFTDAIEVLRARGVWEDTPARVQAHLVRGAAGEVPESPKPGAACFERVRHVVIANNQTALAALEAAARARGLAVTRLAEPLRGEARVVGAEFARRALELRCGRAQLLIAGGETTVTVRGDGRGGRCQELALAAALALAGERGIALLAAGSDGSDGPTDAAGAFADGDTIARGRAADADAVLALANNDAYGFFVREGGLLRTGPTGTNALDLSLALIDELP